RRHRAGLSRGHRPRLRRHSQPPTVGGAAMNPRADTVRTLPVPDGLDGMRVDAGLARLLGLSRTAGVSLAEAGAGLVDGRPVGKSDRLASGSWLEVTLPEPQQPSLVTAEPVAGLQVLHDDADVVVVDKPVGVAAHPSPGWT